MGEKILKRVAALGFFDAVHIGHQLLLKTACARAAKIGAESCAVTFDVHPASFISGNKVMLLNDDLRMRTKLIIEHGGVDEVIVIKFDRDMMNMPFELFFSEILQKRYNVCHVVFGENYTCGRGGAGNAENIPQLCRRLHMGYDIIPAVKSADGQIISSTRIRNYIEDGDIRSAEYLLGYELKKEKYTL